MFAEQLAKFVMLLCFCKCLKYGLPNDLKTKLHDGHFTENGFSQNLNSFNLHSVISSNNCDLN